MSFIKTTLSATIKTSLIVTSLALPFVSQARDITVTITNLTNGLYFTPLLVSAHSHDLDFYELGEPASAHLQAMAEGGDISGLSDDAHDAGADVQQALHISCFFDSSQHVLHSHHVCLIEGFPRSPVCRKSGAVVNDPDALHCRTQTCFVIQIAIGDVNR